MEKMFLGFTGQELKERTEQDMSEIVSKVIEQMCERIVQSVVSEFDVDRTVIERLIDEELRSVMELPLTIAIGAASLMVAMNNDYLTQQLVALKILSEDQLPECAQDARSRLEALR